MEQYLVSIVDIFNYVGKGQRCVIEGEQVLNSKHIICCGIKKRLPDVISVFALCLQTSSLTGKPHELNGTFPNPIIPVSDAPSSLLVSEQACSFDIVCSCKAGQSKKCKHAIAILLYLNRTPFQKLEDLSCTDISQAWGKSKRTAEELYEPCAIDRLCHVNKKERIELSLEMEKEIQGELIACAPNSAFVLHMNGRKASTSITSVCGSKTKTTGNAEETKKIIDSAVTNNDALISHSESDKEFISELSIEQSAFYDKCIIITKEKSAELCERTIAQLGSEWMDLRVNRITGSKCYSLYTFQPKASDWTNKILKHLASFEFKGNKQTRHGILNEPKAVDRYAEVTGHTIKSYGIVINPLAPYLAYSPDGVAYVNNEPMILVEVKCPVIGEKKNILQEAYSGNIAYLKVDNGELSLKEKHQYYGQVQLGMALLNLHLCDLVCYGSFDNSVLVVPVTRNEQFIQQLLSKLQCVYFRHLLPALSKTVAVVV